MRATVWFTEIESPVGPLRLVGDAAGLRRLDFVGGSGGREAPAGWIRAEEPLRPAIDQLRAYFAGTLRAFDLPLVPEGTAFQQRVWSCLRAIPYGATTSYGEIALRIGSPRACRAVGMANGQNPISIVIPCHRVIGKDGSLVGYGGGLEVKRRLLALERARIGSSPEPASVGWPGAHADGPLLRIRW
jgi:methylated-DNA-[protein]-cysteine S-methyltransferase